MVAEYAHTTDGATFSLVDFPPPEANRNPRTLIEGRFVYLPKTAPDGTTLTAVPATELDLYTLQRDTSSPPIGPIDYYGSRVASYVLSGALGQATSTVVETIDWTASRLPIGELYNVRVEELMQIAQRVENQGRTVTGLSDGDKDLQTSDDMRMLYLSMVAQASLPGTTAFKVADLHGVFFPLTIADAQIAVDQIVTFHDAPRLANTDSLNATMIGHRDAGRWEGLATEDLNVGWPLAPAAK